ncbi:GIY-YIG nuclease family protein [Sphingobium cloacae]|uniref:Bacteriophage T5 Orf172 DNA-binding domain-containing protein n=1 Tax=Sphingobium cloacae TaxID=120107 RepID=A0A1E1F575_9SPHN|nr:GIY-YIG nuclease family protein [Sphingobium cloacae]BAV65666.1 hypothetical protein SCLO_1026260 [Sphingobium cloacae]
MRDHIIAEIRRLAAANGGKPPGKSAFQSQTGIGETKWSGVYWSKWGDAVEEAGFSANEWTKRRDTAELTEQFAQITLALGHVPTVRELKLLRRKGDEAAPSPGIISEHFQGQNGVIEALRELSYRDPTYERLRALLPTPKPAIRLAKTATPDGWVYLVKSGEFYKIGRSDEIERRLKEIKVALPDKAVLFHSIQTDDPAGIEAYWHRRFADRRANGEWFKLTSADVAAFKRRKFQ